MRPRAANPGTNPKSESSDQPDLGFVACIEGGVLERQALLFFESIRRYTGAFRNCAVYALSPRAGHTISNQTRRRLDELQVTYIEEILNVECSEYGSANRVAAASYIEQTRSHQILVVLDSDTLFLREPTDLRLPADIGWVESEVGRFWGANQAALSLAIWNSTDSLIELPSTYNYPLHLHGSIDRGVSELIFPTLKHVHYHWLFARDAISSNSLFLPNGPLSTEQGNRLRSATPFDED